MAKQLKDIEIPFGAHDSELDGFEYTIPEGYKAEIKDGKVVVKKTESEDEKIRKMLIEFFRDWGKTRSHCWSIFIPDILVWLKKQGKQKDILEDAVLDSNKDGLIADTIRYKREKQGEQKHQYNSRPRYVGEEELLGTNKQGEQKNLQYLDTSDCVPWSDEQTRRNLINFLKSLGATEIPRASYNRYLSYLEKQSEQKPAWSDEDEKMLNEVILGLNVLKHKDSGEEEKAAYQREIDWLESLKDRVQPQPKQEWSEEDKRMLRDTIAYVEAGIKFDGTPQLNWLKSLRPQTTWKPSDEQMNTLWDAIVYVEDCNSNFKGSGSVLENLYNDLKKLKE